MGHGQAEQEVALSWSRDIYFTPEKLEFNNNDPDQGLNKRSWIFLIVLYQMAALGVLIKFVQQQIQTWQ